MKKTIRLADREYQFGRFPHTGDRSLQAWDAADEYLYDHIQQLEGKEESLLIYNDSFGFLSLALQTMNPVIVNDSACAHTAIRNNAKLNGLPSPDIRYPGDESGTYDLIIMKMVKSLALLSYELSQAIQHLDPDGKIILAGMSKHIHTSTIRLFEKYFDEVSTSLARKKARLLFASGLKEEQKFPIIKSQPTWEYDGIAIDPLPGVFSSGRIDDGTRLLLETISIPKHTDTVIDLGCGCGIIGIHLAKNHGIGTVIFSDDSSQAVRSTKMNWEKHIASSTAAEFLVQHSLGTIPEDSIDLVVTNPPYHQGFTNTIEIALSFFSDAHRVLKEGGELWIVANNHLGYMKSLERIYSRVSRVTKDAAYTIYKAIK